MLQVAPESSFLCIADCCATVKDRDLLLSRTYFLAVCPELFHSTLCRNVTIDPIWEVLSAWCTQYQHGADDDQQ